MRLPFLLCAILGFAVTGAVPARAATPAWPPADMAALESACRADAGIQAMVAGAPAGQPPALNQFCTCFVGTLSDISAADAEILTKDLLGTTTAAERTDHAGYAKLSARASNALGSCQANPQVATAPVPAPAPEAKAPIPEPAPAPRVATAEAAPVPTTPAVAPPAAAPIPAPAPNAAAAPARMSAEAASFLNSCAGSTPFRTYLDHLGSTDSAEQGTICACLTGALVTKVSDTDFPVLARDFGMTDAAPSGSTTTSAGGTARDSLRLCMRSSGITPDF